MGYNNNIGGRTSLLEKPSRKSTRPGSPKYKNIYVFTYCIDAK